MQSLYLRFCLTSTTTMLMIIGAVMWIGCVPSGTQAKESEISNSNGIFELLGTQYSQRLRNIYDHVIKLYKKPIKIEEVSGKIDNTCEVRAHDILICLHRGSSEDSIAHELMHAVLQHEGYPNIFSVRVVPLSNQLRSIMGADLDHLIINERLLNIGYDARQGFLLQADSYESYLKIKLPSDPNGKAIFLIGLLHGLIKFHYYIGDSTAEQTILQSYSSVIPYWSELSKSINLLGKNPKPIDMWEVVRALNRVGDKVCFDTNASFRFSDLLGFDPVLLSKSQLSQEASLIFKEEEQQLSDGTKLVRTFLQNDRILVSAGIASDANSATLMALPVSEFLGKRQIRFLIVEP